ncbi:MAG TPA: hypothetical protein PLR20_04740 [Syntrophales bacterium]|nr:hypothetical protein [Syntrophales bacterium]HPI56321.1 hypothetical protein [Syntrophales bacterium]HPN24291.1 hypothetical protein [Syntrophales bacterium]HQM28643.1 hypothetical protein [Syntrophales bacterium]
MKDEHRLILSELFDGEFPGFVTDAGRDFLSIRFLGDDIRTVRLQDVLDFWEEPGGGPSAFAGISCDWRQAHFLAYMFHEYFMAVHRKMAG